MALMGRADQITAVAERGRAIENQVDGVLQQVMAFVEVRGLTLAGELDTAEQRAVDSTQFASPTQYLSWGLATGLIYNPGTYAKTDEIVELAKVAAQCGGIYATHMRNEDATKISSAARRNGMRFLREDGWLKIRAGVTTPSEVTRVTQEF